MTTELRLVIWFAVFVGGLLLVINLVAIPLARVMKEGRFMDKVRHIALFAVGAAYLAGLAFVVAVMWECATTPHAADDDVRQLLVVGGALIGGGFIIGAIGGIFSDD